MSNNIARNNELYPAVVAGDAAAREAMILNNLGLVVVKVESLIKQIPGIKYLRDDLVSAGNIGLVRAVNKLPTRRISMRSLNKWIGRCIETDIRNVLPLERTIPISSRSIRRAYHKKQPIDQPVVHNAIPETLEAYSDLRVVELRDVMAACCNSDAERDCLQLKEEGHTYKEIGQQLGVSYVTAFRMFHRIKARVLTYWSAE